MAAPRYFRRSIQLGAGLVLLLGAFLCWSLWRSEISRVPVTDHRRASVPAGEVLNITVGPGEKSCRLFGADGRPAEAVTDSTTTQLLFFGKPIMHVVWSICLQRLWKMGIILNDSASGVAQLDKSLSPHVFTIVFTSSRALRYPLLQRLAKSSNALVSAIRYAFKVTGGKQGQLETLRAHFESFGCTLDRSGVIPPSFIMDDPDDCKRFFLYSRSRPISWWVLKSSHGYGGQGITVLPNTTALRNRFGACNQREMFIVQEYLSRPLLLNGRKFDVRALVLIAGTSPYFLFHHDGYLRVSMRRFSFSQDRAVHLTNSHIQVAEKGFSADRHFWSFIQLQDYLDLHEPDNGDFVGRKLVPFVAKTATVILQAGENSPLPSIVSHTHTPPITFHTHPSSRHTSHSPLLPSHLTLTPPPVTPHTHLSSCHTSHSSTPASKHCRYTLSPHHASHSHTSSPCHPITQPTLTHPHPVTPSPLTLTHILTLSSLMLSPRPSPQEFLCLSACLQHFSSSGWTLW